MKQGTFIWGLAIILVPSIFVRLWALCTMWAWFAVPQFNVAPLTKLSAFGLSMFITLMGSSSYKSDEAETDKKRMAHFVKAFNHGLTFPALIVLVSWIVLKLST